MSSFLRNIVTKVPGAKVVLKKLTAARTPALDRESINQQLQI